MMSSGSGHSTVGCSCVAPASTVRASPTLAGALLADRLRQGRPPRRRLPSAILLSVSAISRPLGLAVELAEHQAADRRQDAAAPSAPSRRDQGASDLQHVAVAVVGGGRPDQEASGGQLPRDGDQPVGVDFGLIPVLVPLDRLAGRVGRCREDGLSAVWTRTSSRVSPSSGSTNWASFGTADG